jgi:hypothetical protein
MQLRQAQLPKGWVIKVWNKTSVLVTICDRFKSLKLDVYNLASAINRLGKESIGLIDNKVNNGQWIIYN